MSILRGILERDFCELPHVKLEKDRKDSVTLPMSENSKYNDSIFSLLYSTLEGIDLPEDIPLSLLMYID